MKKIKGAFIFDYDKSADVLYAYMNEPRKAINRELDNGVVLQLEPKSKKVVGFIIVNYNYKFKKGLLSDFEYLKSYLLKG